MSTNNTPSLIILLGATAVGKTSTSIALAQWLDTEIVSTDSRQFYQEMTIGTAKPTHEEQAEVPHHLVDFLSVRDNYDVKQFERDALQAIAHIFEKKPYAIATGGSGLYVKTLCEGIDEMPDTPEHIRQELQQKLEQEGLVSLAEELKMVDPHYYQEADLQNPRRVIRALEVYYTTKKPYSSFRNQSEAKEKRPFNIIKIGLAREREELYARINLRVDKMVKEGLFDEAKALQAYENHNALQTVGYQEIFPYLRGEYDKDEATRLIKRNTRRFAKRQLTWFRRDHDVEWFDLSKNEKQSLKSIKQYLKARLEIRA